MAANGPSTQELHRRKGSFGTFDAKDVLDRATRQSMSDNVFLFVPNLIGYTRIILAALSMLFMKDHPKYCTILYCVSCLLDAFDGAAARALGQTSKFGAVLDMVTDRCTTSCLLCFLSSAYPRYAAFFMFLISLDFSSHYMHMYSSLVTGARNHKAVTANVSRILWYYYHNSTFLFLVCAGNEVFYVALYLMHFYKTESPFAIPFLGSLTYAQLMACATGPVWFYKNYVNVVQLWKASKILVGVDLTERMQARAEQEYLKTQKRQ